jgi:hypothetical protein
MFLCIPSFGEINDVYIFYWELTNDVFVYTVICSPWELTIFFFFFRVISYQPNRVFEFVNLEDKMILFPVVIIIYCINN